MHQGCGFYMHVQAGCGSLASHQRQAGGRLTALFASGEAHWASCARLSVDGAIPILMLKTAGMHAGVKGPTDCVVKSLL